MGTVMAHGWMIVCVFVIILSLSGRLCSRFVSWCRGELVARMLDETSGSDVGTSLDFIVREHGMEGIRLAAAPHKE